MTSFDPFRERTQQIQQDTLAEHIARLTWGADRIRDFQTARLRQLLEVACERSPFHAERLSGVDPRSFEPADLPQLPVMHKAEMMDRFDGVVTDRRLRRRHLEELIAATRDEPMPAFGEYLALTSGGSSGLRGIFTFDAPALAEFLLCTSRVMLAGAAAMGPPPADLRGAMLAAGTPIHATAVGRLIATGPVPFTSIPATLPSDRIVDQIRDLDPHLLIGYPSVLARLAREQNAGRLDIHPFGITSSAENLSTEVRRLIEDAFGVPVIDLFGSSEGLMGLSYPGDETLNLASDCCIDEFVDEDDQPVAPFEPAAAILLTNLYNHVQPLIRYRIDDRFVQQPFVPEHGHVRAKVDGRASDTLRWGDVVVHPLTVTSELLHSPAVVDYVVRQTASGVDVDIVLAEPMDLDALQARVEAALAAAGLATPLVRLSVIDDIARNAQTGKAARFVAYAST
jgi:phenylacetate-coenzyme A ligase PaaK-like adenylate-forming protein